MQTKQALNNDEIILNYIRRNGSVSKAIIARNTGITPPTVTNICSTLAEKGLIYEDRQERSALGRPSMLLKFNEQKEMMLMVHVRTHNVFCYVVQSGGIILYQMQQSIIGLSSEEILNTIYHCIEDIIEDMRWTIAAIGSSYAAPWIRKKEFPFFHQTVNGPIFRSSTFWKNGSNYRLMWKMMCAA